MGQLSKRLYPPSCLANNHFSLPDKRLHPGKISLWITVGQLRASRSSFRRHNLEFVWQGILQGVVGPSDATTRNSRKLFSQTSLPASHQYRLQIAEGMVTFLESYERELEKYWRKTLFFQLKQRIRSLPDSSDAHKGRRQKLPGTSHCRRQRLPCWPKLIWTT